MARCNHAECKGGGDRCIYLYTPTSPPPLALKAADQAKSLRTFLSAHTSILGISGCGAKFLAATHKNGKREIKEVTDHCRNKHACPECMRYQYSKLDKDLRACLDWWCTDRSVYTQTLTLPNRNKSLVYKHQDLRKAWTELGKTKAFKKLRDKYGMTQYLRIAEDSLKLKGSFPHFHLTWFFSSKLAEAEMQDFCEQLAELWVKAANKAGIRGAQAIRQWYGSIKGGNKSYVQYLTKHGYFDLSFDPKNANSTLGLKPLDFLRVLQATGEIEYLEVWLEYEQATRGLHRVQTSKKFFWQP